MHKKTITIIAAIMSFSAQAEWSLIGSGRDGVKTYVDFSTIKKTRSGYRAWSIKDYSKSPFKDGVRSVKSLEEYDCSEERYRYLKDIGYLGNMGHGNVKGTYDEVGDWIYIAPESIGEDKLKQICGKSR